MSGLELTFFLIMAGYIWYWLDGMRVKELARRAGKKYCDNAGVVFLDDTVVLMKARLRRSRTGSLAVFRKYAFEFSGDVGMRYHGTIAMSGKILQKVEMQAYRIE